jgi:hypothetical protein
VLTFFLVRYAAYTAGLHFDSGLLKIYESKVTTNLAEKNEESIKLASITAAR